MKIKGTDWLDWLHHSRAKAQAHRKSKKQTLAQYLRSIEQKEEVVSEQFTRPLKKGRK